MQYYNSNANPIIQNGILVYGCCSYSSLLPIYLFQKKILKFIHFRKRVATCEDILGKNSYFISLGYAYLRVINIRPEIKKSPSNSQRESFCNELFCSLHHKKETRQKAANLMKISCFFQQSPSAIEK